MSCFSCYSYCTAALLLALTLATGPMCNAGSHDDPAAPFSCAAKNNPAGCGCARCPHTAGSDCSRCDNCASPAFEPPQHKGQAVTVDLHSTDPSRCVVDSLLKSLLFILQ